MLSLPRARVQSLVRELRSHKPLGVAKKKKERKKEKDYSVGKNVLRQREKLNSYSPTPPPCPNLER